MSFNMRKFVTKNRVTAFGGQLFETRGDQNDGPKDSPRDGRGNCVVLQQRDAAPGAAGFAQLDSSSFQRREEIGVSHGIRGVS